MTRRITAAQYRELAKKKPKYRNVRVKMDGHTFDSKAEARRWEQLRIMQAAGKIYGLTRQVRHPLRVYDVLITTYVADFVYALPGGHAVAEDTKGVLTDSCRIKLKLMGVCYGLKVRLLTRKTNPELWRKR